MKNLNLFLKPSCVIAFLLITCVVHVSAQNELIGYTHLETYGGSSYYLSNCEATWEEANEAATEMGGYLATLTNWYEFNVLTSLILNFEGAYVGDELAGIWIGLQGENGIYNWANGEPIYNYYWSYNTYPVLEPIYADGAALLAPGGWDDYNSWFTHPVSGMAEYLVEFPEQPNCDNNPNKTYVCHNGNTICVNITALQSHLDQGDLEGPCGPCNTNAMQVLPDNESEIAGHSLQPLNSVFPDSQEPHHIDNGSQVSNQMHIYPNPASEQILVMLPEINEEGTLRILSITGQEMHTLPLSRQKSFSPDTE